MEIGKFFKWNRGREETPASTPQKGKTSKDEIEKFRSLYEKLSTQVFDPVAFQKSAEHLLELGKSIQARPIPLSAEETEFVHKRFEVVAALLGIKKMTGDKGGRDLLAKFQELHRHYIMGIKDQQKLADEKAFILKELIVLLKVKVLDQKGFDKDFGSISIHEKESLVIKIKHEGVAAISDLNPSKLYALIGHYVEIEATLCHNLLHEVPKTESEAAFDPAFRKQMISSHLASLPRPQKELVQEVIEFVKGLWQERKNGGDENLDAFLKELSWQEEGSLLNVLGLKDIRDWKVLLS